MGCPLPSAVESFGFTTCLVHKQCPEENLCCPDEGKWN